jgi:hypothetical protein
MFLKGKCMKFGRGKLKDDKLDGSIMFLTNKK